MLVFPGTWRRVRTSQQAGNRMSKLKTLTKGLLLLGAFSALPLSQASAQVVVPGTGYKIAFDDFEKDGWEFYHNHPKSSEEQDGQVRHPAGYSNNGMWGEGLKRGQPDYMKTIDTPPGGLAGSKKSLLIRTRDAGRPGTRSFKMQQDDLIFNTYARTGGPVDIGKTPSFVVRVYFPPFDQWDPVTGTTFGLRGDVSTTKMEEVTKRFLFIKRKKSVKETELYWPGMFVQFNSKKDPQYKEDSAFFIIRCDATGKDIVGPQIKQLGWWTLGMTFTPDGRVHYFASPGVNDLTYRDLIATHYPYGNQCEKFNTMFFNITSRDDGRTWSTPWVIDDPAVYVRRR
ncbi:MAG: hypothetical protein KDA84_08870 [Planctomycetaceae bacterium]|nr:hypothetical protein [Planctomycetaceae bacterium]